MVSIHGDAPLGVVHREMFKTATPLRRSLLSLALSLLLHGGVLVGVVALAAAAAGRPAALSPASLILVSVLAPPQVLPELSATEPKPEARPESLPVLDFPEPALEPIVAESITRTEPETKPVPEPEPEPGRSRAGAACCSIPWAGRTWLEAAMLCSLAPGKRESPWSISKILENQN